MTDIVKAKQDQVEMENQISMIIREYERKHELKVAAIDYERQTANIGGKDVPLVYRVKVKIEL